MKRLLLLLCLVLSQTQVLHAQGPTWASDVAPILFDKCAKCHHTGGLAPFSLTTYNDALSQAQGIKYSTQNRIMPPWPPDPAYSELAHPRILSASQIATIAQWVDDGAPEGNPANAPVPPTFSNAPAITNPTITGQIPAFTSTATTADIYQCFVIPTNRATDEYITAVEVIPGNTSIVHHVLVFQDTSGKPAQLDAADPNPGYLNFGGTGSNSSKLIATYVPGSQPNFLPNGMGILLPKGANIVLQIHYPAGSAGGVDSTRFLLRTTSQTLRSVSTSPILNHTTSLTNGPLTINANQQKTFYAQQLIPAKVTALSVGPHFHLIGRSIKVYATKGTDTTKVISIPDWNFSWQGGYYFKRALIIPSGTTVRSETYYDNTASNPYQPSNPPQQVVRGEATTNEMMLVYFSYVTYQAGDENLVFDSTSSTTAINPALVKNSFRAYPNPSSSELTIELDKSVATNAVYRMLDISGRSVQSGNLSGISTRLNVQNLPSGMYTIEVGSANLLQRERVVISR
jgi:hypothetical protein